jgi:SRSO17 transposase
MERMEEKVPDSDEQSLQHFISNSSWKERAVIDQIAKDADKHLGGNKDSALYIDETGFLKKGKKSVGVSRQWIGQKGKVDNCQTGVFAALGCKRNATLIDFRLYLPKVWTKDKKRCQEAGVPKEKMVFKDKHDLAIEMITHSRAQGIRFNWVGCDAFYGKDPAFLRSIDQMGEVFVADVHKDQRIYLKDPDPVVPLRSQTNKGKKPTKLKAQSKAVSVNKWAEQQQEGDWQRISLRNTTKGKLVVEVLHQRVWLWDGKEEKANQWHLIVRREIDSTKTLKYSLSNAPANIKIQRLAFMQAQRYWIERSFQNGKNQCGMEDYQVQGWRGWHHHMTMVILAMLFLLEERIRCKKAVPLLSCYDVTTLLKHFLPRRDITAKEIIRQMQIRHMKRRASSESAYKIQRAKGILVGVG